MDKKIELKDLLATLQEETGYSILKKELDNKKNKVKQPLPPPLPKRIQEKFNRQAAYEETKKEISKWEPIVKRNRESDHLEFSKSSSAASYQLSNNTLAGTFKASTELEKQVEHILEESGFKEKDIQQYEELELNKLTIEEIQSRRRELRMMRELMFREDLKAKRIAKIKSKTYHKIKKREREKNKLNLEQLSQLDPELGHQEQLKLEAARAQERMTLKHKNTSRWAKQALKYGRRNDAESRQAIVEQLQLHEKLKRKISGLDSDENESNHSDDQSVQDFVKDLEDAHNKDEDQSVKGDNLGRRIDGNPGRMVFGSNTSLKNQGTTSKTIDTEKLIQFNKSSELVNSSKTPDKIKQHPKNSNNDTNSDQEIDDDNNPWLQTEVSSKISTSKNKSKVNKDTQKSEKSVIKIKKKKRKLHDDEEILNDVEIDLDKVLTMMSAGQNSDTTSQVSKKKKSTESLSTTTAIDNFASLDQYDDDDYFDNNKTPIGFSQRELVARAFANDNVVEEFEEEKLATIDEDAPKEKDLTLPGWGSWAGKGVKKRLTKNNDFRVIQKPVHGEGIEMSKRKDANLKHVIINEKRIKKATKYLATQVPYPYETREQYERSLRNPLGKEWNTYEVFQKMVKPRVITKMGTIIDPPEKPET
ncbi:4136_t:CDS:2 [Ambispora leptoticha]|uniref:4136_t:CDS:1 n=1 Tax=Ambispora leptoticha TaxID=144679 RepID=A0A9N8VWR4_9GLOM|nr:4136_t:CDS:2 [Ambispora leptoticha]